MNIGIRLRTLRDSRKLTTRQLAETVNLTQQTISNYENNKSQPSYEVLDAICSSLGLTLAEFFSKEPLELEPDLQLLLEESKGLTFDQRWKLVEFLRSMRKD